MDSAPGAGEGAALLVGHDTVTRTVMAMKMKMSMTTMTMGVLVMVGRCDGHQNLDLNSYI